MSNYIGYPTVEEFVKEIRENERRLCLRDKVFPNPNDIRVNVCRFVHCGAVKSDNGFGADTIFVIASQIDRLGDVHYARLRLFDIQTYQGKPLEEDEVKHDFSLADQCHQLTTGWLEAQGFVVCNAVVAMPTNMVYLDGHAGFLGYDKEHKRFYSKDGGESAVGVSPHNP